MRDAEIHYGYIISSNNRAAGCHASLKLFENKGDSSQEILNKDLRAFQRREIPKKVWQTLIHVQLCLDPF